MTPDKYARLKGLFERALETSPRHREVMIEKVRQADEELGRELEALLAAHTDSGEDGTGTDRTHSMDRPVFEFHGPSDREKPSFAKDELLLERFRIVRFIGRGGMGEVYEAEDMEVGRVALKTIRADLAARAGMMERFRQEVQLARKVTSTNVCRIHDLFPFPAGDRRSAAAFLTMEFLEGVTLADRIDSQGALPLPEAEATALQLCAALQAIHEAGVIHRDIKGRNVMLAPRNGVTQAVVMDLGLARESATKADGGITGLTVPGAVMGTPNYMAPEQFEGAQATPATDIYALGVVLYEMVTGKLPFEGSTPMQAAVRRAKSPPPPSSLRGKLPRQWDEVIGRCLEYEPGKRYQSGSEVAEALRGRRPVRLGAYAATAVLLAASVAGVARLPWRNPGPDVPKTVVVLPFENLGGDAANQALCDGLQETTTSMLSQIGSSVQVVPASDLRSNQVKTIADARNKFNADLVLTGSVQKSGDSLQLTLNLNDAKTQRQRDSRILVVKPDEMASLQQQLAGKIDGMLGAGSTLRAQQSGPGETTRDSEAYKLYIQGAGALQDLKLDEAVDDLQKAVDKDPEFSAADGKLAEACVRQYYKSQDTKWLARADSVLNQPARNGQSPEVLFAQAMIWQATGENEKAEALLRQLLRTEPSSVSVLNMLAESLKAEGKDNEAEETYRTAIRLRPGYWPTYNTLGLFYMNLKQHDYQKAEQHFLLGIEAAPQISSLHSNLGVLYSKMGRWKDAESEFRKSIALRPYPLGYSNLGTALFYEGKYADAAGQFEKATELQPANPVNWGNLGDARWQLTGERNRAREAFEKARTLANQKLIVNPENADLRSNYALYLAKLGQTKDTEREIAAAVAQAPEDMDVVFYSARVYAVMGDLPRAFAALKKCLALGHEPREIEEEPDFSPLRQDPRYGELNISRNH